MMVLEKRPEIKVRSAYKPELLVERTDISFQDLPGGLVQVQVTVHNPGEQLSPPTLMRLESAPFGAFVDWRPLARLPVPALEPGESRTLSVKVARPRPTPLGDFRRVPPGKVLTAVNAPDQSSPRSGGLATILGLLRTAQTGQPAARNLNRPASLAPDLWDLLGRGQQHWAGNINVFVGHRAVERHLARALRVYPGRTNLAMFVVGSNGKRNSFAFQLVGLRSDWQAVLFNATNGGTLVVDPSEAPIEETDWVESSGSLLAMLAVHPPLDCDAGKLAVHVTRQTDRKTAIVEFDLDPSAQGAGCYSM